MIKTKFGDIVINTKGKVDRSNNPFDCFIAGGHMESEDFIINRKGYFDTSDVGPAFIRTFKSGQILYGSRRTYLKKVSIPDFDGVTSNTTFVFDAKNEDLLIKDLIPFLMLSDGFTNWSISKSKGSTNPYVLFSDLEKYTFYSPEKDKQERLSVILWAIENAKRSYVDSITSIEKYLESKFIDMFGNPQKNKGKWKEVPIIDIIESPQAGVWGKEDLDESGVKVLKTTNFTDEGFLDFSNVVTREIPVSKIASRRLVNGDILIEKSGGADNKPVGRVVYFDIEDEEYLYNNFTAALRLNDSRFHSKYLFMYLFINYNLGGTKRYENKTTGIHNLKLTDYLENTLIPVAPINMQEDFIRLMDNCSEMKSNLLEAITDSKNLIKKIVNKNFIDVREV